MTVQRDNAAIYKYYRNRCLKCGGWKNLTIHEVQPRSHFGNNDDPFKLENCVVLCWKCHDWAHRIGTTKSIPILVKLQQDYGKKLQSPSQQD